MNQKTSQCLTLTLRVNQILKAGVGAVLKLEEVQLA